MDEILPQIMAFLLAAVLLGVPIIAFSMRFALKPLVEAYIRMKEVQQGGSGELPIIKQQLALFDQRLQAMEDHMNRLDEVVDFHRQLEKPQE